MRECSTLSSSSACPVKRHNCRFGPRRVCQFQADASAYADLEYSFRIQPSPTKVRASAPFGITTDRSHKRRTSCWWRQSNAKDFGMLDLHPDKEDRRKRSQRPTVVCCWCGKTLERGSTLVSDGLCVPCLPSFVASGETPVRVSMRRSSG